MGEQKEIHSVSRKLTGLPAGIAAVLALMGSTAIVAQIVLMRELMVVFCGNELSLGLMLANWLLWTAAGSSLLGRITAKCRNARQCMAGLQLLIALALPATIFAVRASRGYIQGTPGELLGPGSMFLTSFATLSVFCLLSGCMFAAGSRFCAVSTGSSVAAATGSVYLLEAAGSCLGGLVASSLLIPYFTAFQIAGIMACLNLFAAACLVIKPGLHRRWVVLAAVGAIEVALATFMAPKMEQDSLRRLWRGFRLVEVRNSRYGNLAVVNTEGTRSLYENGLVFASVPNPEAAEEAVHLALLQHPAPKRLLLIGGGINGSLRQALQHPTIEQVDYVELDPVILDLADTHFAGEWHTARADLRVKVHRLDGRLFMKTMDATFDVIVVNLPDPQTAQLNRFYTREFYQEAAKKLTPEGILSFQVTAAENYISPQLGEFLRCINRTLREVFPEVTAIPGESVHFFAARRGGSLVVTPKVLMERLKARHLQTLYVREYFLPFRMSPDRMLDLRQQIEPDAETRINRDFAPIAYYFDVALWSSRFHPGASRWFGALTRISFPLLLGGLTAPLTALTVLSLVLLKRRDRSRTHSGDLDRLRFVTGFCVAAMGFAAMGLEILILLGFQAIYGYVYQRLAMMIAAVMAGMALGAWLAGKKSEGTESEDPSNPATNSVAQCLRAVGWLQLSAALAPILLFAVLQGSTKVRPDFGLGIVSQIAFPLLALIVGMMGGYQFSLASQVYFAGREPSSPGMLYGLDLLGAALGAVILSLFWIPVYGFLRSALLMGVVSMAPAISAVIWAERARNHQG